MTDPKDDVFGMVDGYLHDLLDARERQYVEQQIESNDVWRVAMEQAKARHEAVNQVATSEASERLIQHTIAGINEHEQRFGKIRRRLLIGVPSALAAVIVVLASLNIYYVNMAPSPFDLHAIGQTQLLTGTAAAMRVRLINRQTGQAVTGVPILINLIEPNGQYHRLASFTTDAHGSGNPAFDVPDIEDGDYQLVISADTSDGDEVLTRTVTLKRQWKLMLSTDRPVYKPGQTIRIRSLALRRPDMKPIAGKDTIYKLTDPRGNIIFKQRTVTSEFGIASTECRLAGEIDHGAYTLTCATGDTESKTVVQVKKYVLPKFKIAVDLDKSYYQPDQVIEGSISADYFFGKPVTNAQVEMKAFEISALGRELITSRLTTDDNGKATFKVELPGLLIGRPQNTGDSRIALQFKVTDQAGQVQTKQLTRMVTSKPLRVEVIPELGTLVKGVTNTIYVFTTYADGAPAKTAVTMTGFDQARATGKTGVTSFQLTPDKAQVKLAVLARDEKGNIANKSMTLQTGQAANDFMFRLDEAVYHGGDTMTLSATGGGKEPIFIDLIKDDQTLVTQTVDMSKGNGTLDIDLVPELTGTLRVVAYRMSNVTGAPVRRSRVVYVAPASQVKITAAMDRTQYQPGRSAKLKLTLTDGKGKPVTGAISLAAVDEAVFSVLEQRPGMESVFFTLEKELLEPVYAIYNWTAPHSVDSGFVDYHPVKPLPSNIDYSGILEDMLHGVLIDRPDVAQVNGQKLLVLDGPQLLVGVVSASPRRKQIDRILEYGLRMPDFKDTAQTLLNRLKLARLLHRAPRPGRAVSATDIKGFLDEKELEQALFARTAAAGVDHIAALEQLVGGRMSQRWIDSISSLQGDSFDQQIESMRGGYYLPEVSDALKDSVRPTYHALTACSYPVKVRDVNRTRRSGLDFVIGAWATTGVTAVLLIFYIGVFLLVRKWYLAAGIVAGPVFALMCLSTMWFSMGGVKFAEMDSMAPMAQVDSNAAGGMEFGGTDGGGIPKSEAIIPPRLSLTENSGGAAAPPRLRQWFPETLLWKPQLITDDNGQVSIDINLADSITTWRLSTSAVTSDGRLGASQQNIRVFQPFFVDLNLPVSLTRHDEVAVPAVVYNYLDKPQTVVLTLEQSDWFELLDEPNEPVARIELKPREVRSVSFRIKAKKVGFHHLQITAEAGKDAARVADAIKKRIEVVPNGRMVEQVINATLQQPATHQLDVPDNAVEGSVKTLIKLYPTAFSQLVEGLDGIFARPYGCFEQTSSTTYPNILALDYLKRTRKSAPATEAKARQYIHLGYQRLVSFEVSGGGFDWFGRPPANQMLTAYGLMEFKDMQRVHDVDPDLITRTRHWLLSKRNADGSWPADSQMINDGLAGSVQRGKDLQLAATAYIGWAVFGDDQDATGQASSTLRFLLSRTPDSIKSPYVLALVANAILSIDADKAAPYVDQLEAIKNSSEQGKLIFWNQSTESRTAFYGSGVSANIETTALAALAMIKTPGHSATSRGALNWITQNRDANGTWHSTQATVLALKALLAGSGSSLGGDKARRIQLTINGDQIPTIEIAPDQSDVMQLINFSDRMNIGAANQQLALADLSNEGTSYQLVLRYHVPDEANQVSAPPRTDQPLDIQIEYDKTDLSVGQTIKTSVTVRNQMNQTAPMIMLDLPIPPGFAIKRAEFDKLKNDGVIARYEVTPRSVVVYLLSLPANGSLKLDYSLTATMPVKVTAQAAEVYEYYDPDKQARSKTAQLTAR